MNGWGRYVAETYRPVGCCHCFAPPRLGVAFELRREGFDGSGERGPHRACRGLVFQPVVLRREWRWKRTWMRWDGTSWDVVRVNRNVCE